MLLGFKPRFVDPILFGTKVHTMRKPRKIKPKTGETLYMYTGLRTKNCGLITKKESLISVQRVLVTVTRNYVANDCYSFNALIWVDGRKLTTREVKKFVCFDGFSSPSDFCTFWFTDKRGLCITEAMELYHWTTLRY